MNTQIRQATVEDAPSISLLNANVHQLHVNAAPHFFKPITTEPFSASIVIELLNKPQNRFYIASADGVDVGYIYLELLDLPEDRMRYARRWVYIHQIAVEPAYQQQGHGQHLIETAKQVARELGMHTVALDTWEFNTQAHRFFEQQGFSPFRRHMWLEVTQ